MESDRLMPRNNAPHLLVFDSGLGGLSVLRALQGAVPEAKITYLADDAFFPYGAHEDSVLIERICTVLGEAITAHMPDAVVLACNTASTIALPSLRAAHSVPFIGTVPAIKPAAQLSKNSMISVLGTNGTVRRDYTRSLIAEYGSGSHFTLIGSGRLASLTENIMAGALVPDDEIAAEIAPCFIEQDGRRTDVIVLGCTHYPLLLDRLKRLAPWPVIWLDPAPAIARRTANVLVELGFAVGVGFAGETGRMIFTSGKMPPPDLAKTLDAYGLAVSKPADPVLNI